MENYYEEFYNVLKEYDKTDLEFKTGLYDEY